MRVGGQPSREQCKGEESEEGDDGEEGDQGATSAMSATKRGRAGAGAVERRRDGGCRVWA